MPDLVWALLFVTAVGLGPFPGGLALAVHSVGMLGRLFAETIENMDMAPIDALSLTGASRLQVFTPWRGAVGAAGAAGIGLYRLDENIRSSLVLGFVGAGGIGFQLLTAMNLFQYRQVSLLLIVVFVIVSPPNACRPCCGHGWHDCGDQGQVDKSTSIAIRSPPCVRQPLRQMPS